MSRKSRFQVGARQRVRRKQRRDKATTAGKNPDKLFIGGIYIKANA